MKDQCCGYMVKEKVCLPASALEEHIMCQAYRAGTSANEPACSAFLCGECGVPCVVIVQTQRVSDGPVLAPPLRNTDVYEA